ncbi:RNA-directed DNA polymerase [Macrococcus epidermidis]|uniref:RNA-directed DNA polymerase n=2 Tax=Macrococcus epidermidis TaxID=1902580 RepID=A0A327ZNY7_9STAP|nr:RNA-directed DNA polymerase [Macrococcus epidermidis]
MIGVQSNYFYKCLYSNEYFYKTVKIPKRRNDEYRELTIPTMALKNIQRWILDNILYKFSVHPCAKGFVPGKSIIDNAIPHINKKYVVKMDVKNFFPSISFKDVRILFLNLGYKIEVAIALANLCTYKNTLPQGSPTSPYIANLIFYKIDKRISGFCNKNNLTYTRYADDITISGKSNISFSIKIINQILTQNRFELNDKKTKVLKPGDRKIVTGIIVNEKLTIPKDFIRNVKRDLYYINRFGLLNHLNFISIAEDNSEYYLNSLSGKISFIKMVDYKQGYILQNELDNIIGYNDKHEEKYIDLEDIDIKWEKL